MKPKVAGSFLALVTPMNADYSIDCAGFETLLEFQAAAGTSAVLIMGASGEVSMLTPEERRAIVAETMKPRRPLASLDPAALARGRAIARGLGLDARYGFRLDGPALAAE